MSDIAALEDRIQALENQIADLQQTVEACCGNDGAPRPCRSGRAIMVAGYDVASSEEARAVLAALGYHKRDD